MFELQLTLQTNLGFFIAATCFLFGILGLATYPVGLELASECTFPVSEATSTGLIVLSGQVNFSLFKEKYVQVQSVIYVFIMKYFTRDLPQSKWENQVCKLDDADTVNIPKDNTISILVYFSFSLSLSFQIFSVLASCLVVILVLFFKPTYRRLEAERENRALEDKQKEARGDNGRITLPVDKQTEPLNL